MCAPLKRLWWGLFKERASDTGSLWDGDLEDTLLTTDKGYGFLDFDELEAVCAACTVLAGAVAAVGVVEKDTRLDDLYASHAALKEAHESRKAELAVAKQELSKAVSSNASLLQLLLARAEEQVGLPAAHSKPLQQRMLRVNKAFQVAANKETHGRFASSPTSPPGAPKYHTIRGRLAAWNASDYSDPATADAMNLQSEVFARHLPANLVPNFKQVTSLPEKKTLVQGMPLMSPRTTCVGVRPTGEHEKEVGMVKVLVKGRWWAEEDERLRRQKSPPATPVDIPLRLEASFGSAAVRSVSEMEAMTMYSVGARSSAGNTLAYADRARWDARLMKVLEDVFGADPQTEAEWMPSEQLLVTSTIALPLIAMKAELHNYMLWDHDGIEITLDTCQGDGPQPDSGTMAPSHSLSGPGKIPVTIRTASAVSFTSIAAAIRKAGHAPQLVIPTTPCTFDVIFKHPAPTTSQIRSLCRGHGWQLFNPSIGGEIF